MPVNYSGAGYAARMSTPSDEADVTRRLTEDASGAEEARRRWLAEVTADPRLTDGHRVVAEISRIPIERLMSTSQQLMSLPSGAS